jgi:hypothetical protein
VLTKGRKKHTKKDKKTTRGLVGDRGRGKVGGEIKEVK